MAIIWLKLAFYKHATLLQPQHRFGKNDQTARSPPAFQEPSKTRVWKNAQKFTIEIAKYPAQNSSLKKRKANAACNINSNNAICPNHKATNKETRKHKPQESHRKNKLSLKSFFFKLNPGPLEMNDRYYDSISLPLTNANIDIVNPNNKTEHDQEELKICQKTENSIANESGTMTKTNSSTLHWGTPQLLVTLSTLCLSLGTVHWGVSKLPTPF